MEKRIEQMGWAILLAGITCIAWTVVLHGRLYGFTNLVHRNSSIVLIMAALLIMTTAWSVNRGLQTKQGVFFKLVYSLDHHADYELAVLIPILFFTTLFLCSPNALQPFETFLRQISLPLLVYSLLLLIAWIMRTALQILSRMKPVTVEGSQVLVIHRKPLYRAAWVLFVFLAVSNLLASILIHISKTGTFAGMLSSRFLVENETSLYTYASALFLGLIAVGFGWLVFSTSKLSLRLTWAGLAGLFLVFSVDEVIAYHEGIIAAMRQLGNELTSSFFVYLAPVGLMILVIIFLALRALTTNRIERRGVLLLGFVMFFGGAVFIESISEFLEIVYGEGRLPFLLIKSLLFLEEGLELSGTYLIFFFVMDQFFGKKKQIQIE